MSVRRGRSRALVIARTELRQLRQAPDFWVPLAVIAGLFFVVIPAALLLLITHVSDVHLVQQLSNVVGSLPKPLREHVKGDATPAQASCTRWRCTCSPRWPSSCRSPSRRRWEPPTVIGERGARGSSEPLAHSPASEREIYLGKLIASLLPGYLTAALGFGLYSLVVNLTVGPQVGGWFFPTPNWWILVLWVLPPFICLGLSVILAISAKVSSTAAARHASALVTLPLVLVAYTVASGTLFRTELAAFVIGAVAWIGAGVTLARGSHTVRRERLLGLGG